jgi:hypothetical protein
MKNIIVIIADELTFVVMTSHRPKLLLAHILPSQRVLGAALHSSSCIDCPQATLLAALGAFLDVW